MRRALAVLSVVALLLGNAGQAGARTPGPARAPEYWFDDWHIPQLWASGIRGQGITIGLIDTGVNAAVPELAGRVLAGTDLGPTGGNGQIDRDKDAFGHGTAMASIMVGAPGPDDITGLAPAAKILPVAVPIIGTTDDTSTDQLPAAIRYAVDHGADIISMSIGGKRYPVRNGLACPPDEQAAVDHAIRAGVIVVAAVGNDGPTRNAVEEPGVCLGVISVGAVDARGRVASFSSREPYLTVSAPGVAVASLSRTIGDAYTGDGTSQAAAIVSGVLALEWSAQRGLPARQIVSRLLNTLDDPRTTPSPAYGYGIVDGYAAATAVVPATAPNPVYARIEPFLARGAAFARPTPVPAPAARGMLGSGGYAVRGSARPGSSRVAIGLGLAGVGALLLVGLGATGWRRRARAVRRSRPVPS